MKKLRPNPISEQIKNGLHTIQYEDGSIACEPITPEEEALLFDKFGGRNYYEY